VTLNGAILGLFDRQVGQSVLAEQALCTEVCRQEIAVAVQSALWRQASHVCRLHNVLQVYAEVAAKERGLSWGFGTTAAAARLT
jgi:hypothetical protein